MQSQVLNYSTAKKDDGTFRLDAEHYQEKYLRNQKKLLDFGAAPLLSMISRPVITGHTPSMKIDSYYGDDVAFVKTDNLREFKISGRFSHRLSQKGNEVIKRSVLQKGDLIMTIIGATYKIVGRSALVRAEDLPANINQNIALIRLKKTYSPEFLSAYLNSEIGKLATWYLSRQTEQVNLNCREIEKILVPKVSQEFALTIEGAYKKAVLFEHKSRSAFLNAESLLLSEIGLIHWQPKHQLSFIKNLSDTEHAGRIDAEYFQPKYDELLQAIRDNSEYVKRISEIYTYNARGLQPEYVPDGELDVITSKHILDHGLDYDGFEKTDLSNWNSQNKARVTRGDILTYTTGANIGRTAYYPLDKKALASNHVNILRIKDENPEYIAFVLNSMVGRLQTERMSAGSAQAELYPKDIDNFIIPFIAEISQKSILNKIDESFSSRRQSEHLLESAKRAVEMAIEQDEQSAIDWLNDQIEV